LGLDELNGSTVDADQTAAGLAISNSNGVFLNAQPIYEHVRVRIV